MIPLKMKIHKKMKIPTMNNNIEIRNYSGAIPYNENSRHVEGYALVFESQSCDLGFFETIDRNALSQELIDNSDVFALLNHDQNKVLARSNKGAGSLTLTLDERGLKYEFDAADTQLGNDLLEYIKRGEINTSSFAFSIDPNDKSAQTWEKRNGTIYRTIHKIAGLYDVSPVWNAAYPATSVSKRYLDDFKKEERAKILKSLDDKLDEIEKISNID